ncbi:MAG: response regulator [Gemmataceae bacterium]
MSSHSDVDILLVEDNPDDVELTLRTFQENSVSTRVHVVRDGVEALDFLFATGSYHDRAGAKPPRVVLLDLKLPRVDGLEVLRRVRSDPRTQTLPMVVLTSSQEERDLVESYQLGVNSFLVKPVDSEQFTDLVKQLGCYWLLLNKTRPDSAHS